MLWGGMHGLCKLLNDIYILRDLLYSRKENPSFPFALPLPSFPCLPSLAFVCLNISLNDDLVNSSTALNVFLVSK